MKTLHFLLIVLWSTGLYATEYYVAISGNDKNNGKTEKKAWRTIQHAVLNARAGDTVWIKSGNYGSENVVFKTDGRKGSPISFIGYKKVKGDISSMYYKYSKEKSLEDSEMPMLDGKHRGKGVGFKLYGRSYIIIKNIQITNYRYCIDALSGANNLVIDNIIASNSGGTDRFGPVSGGNCIRMDTNTNHDNKIVNSVVMNATMVAITVGGDNNIIENNKTYADQDDINRDKRSMDYHVLISGSNNIVRNHYAEHVGDLAHTGHGIVLKSLAGTVAVENNLIENCDIVNINGSVEFRHRKVKNNIARDIRIKAIDSRYPGGFHFRDGASLNIVENSHVKNLRGLNGAISFYDTVEDGGTQWSGNDNVVKNTVFENCDLGIRLGTNGTPSNAYNNKVLNCTFFNVNTLYGFWPRTVNKNNLIQNCIISNNKVRYLKNVKESGWFEKNNNYSEVGYSIPKGEGNISFDPNFVEPAKSNFKLKSNSKLIDKGVILPEVKRDFEGNLRPQGSSHDIGAFEYKDEKGSSIEAKILISETSICYGESVTLRANGGASYLWSTGETTEEITVQPTETSVYSVTVIKGELSDTDSVTVTINPLPKINAGEDVSIDQGASIILTAKGGDTYLWSTGETTASITVSPETTTDYSVIGIKEGCESSDVIRVTVEELSIKEPQAPEANAGEDITICYGESTTLNGSGGEAFKWSNGETSKNIIVSPSRTTIYELEVVRNGKIDIDSVVVTVDFCGNERIKNELVGPSFKAFPNPTHGVLNINVEEVKKDYNLDIFSLNGNIVYRGEIKATSLSYTKHIDLSKFINGVYIVRLYNSNESYVKKIVRI